MKDGFIKVKAISPEIVAGDVNGNLKKLKDAITDSERAGVKILVTPELCLCGYSAYDLICHSTIISSCKWALEELRAHTKGKDILCIIGAPVQVEALALDCAVVIKGGEYLGIVPKTALTRDERRIFSTINEYTYALIGKESVKVSPDLIFECASDDAFSIGIEIGADINAKAATASVICNLSASPELLNSEEQRRLLVKAKSLANNCAYIMANASASETSTDVIFSAHNIICENGVILAQSKPFERKNGECVSEIDVQSLGGLRLRGDKNYPLQGDVAFEFVKKTTMLTRRINLYPFRIADKDIDKAIEIQARGLAKRLEASYSSKMVVGISGGLDSTIALVAMVKCADLMDWEREQIIAITMPCFGTTSRTKANAINLCKEYGVDLREIDISEAVRGHFSDIDHNEDNINVTFENAQARERTQVLMDVANDENALVVGTGDLSEIALGWCTYNADHMSMYNVNGSLPKTLIRQILTGYAKKCENVIERNIIFDVLDTPISPELLPTDENGALVQKTEESVGSYDLNDFFLYNMIHMGFSPSKTYRLACIAFEEKEDPESIYNCLERFIKRFFSQQFKRSCSPDGIQVCELSLSPRGAFKMSSDMSCKGYLDDLANA